MLKHFHNILERKSFVTKEKILIISKLPVVFKYRVLIVIYYSHLFLYIYMIFLCIEIVLHELIIQTLLILQA